MSSIKMQMDGLNELRDALHKLPEDLLEEAADIVIAHAEEARREIQEAYPVRTTNLNRRSSRTGKWFPPGILKARVTSLKNRSLIATSALVQSRAPHAWIYEHGTEGRKRRTDKGWNRGAMPEAPLERRMIPKAIKWRARMVKALTELVQRAGFEVHQS